MPMFDEETVKLLGPFLANEEIEHAKLYLDAGRKYAGLSDDELTAQWLEGWRAFFLWDFEPACALLWDYTAEFGLRGLSTPEHLLSPAELERGTTNALRGTKADTVMQDQVRKEVVKFRDTLARPNN